MITKTLTVCGCFRFWIVLNLAILAALGPLHACASTVKVIPLYLQESLDANGKPFPISPGMAKFVSYFERELDVRFQTSQIPMNRAKMLALQGEGIIWAFSKTAERLQNYQFSETVMLSHIWAVAYGDPHLPLRSMNDLKGKTVSVERGVSHGMAFENARNIIFNVDEDASAPAVRFKKLVAKRSDVLLWGLVQFDNHDKFLAYLNTKYIPSIKDPSLAGKIFYVSDTPLFYDSIHFAAAKNRFTSEMIKIDIAIRTGLKSGVLTKILREMEE